ncbi:MAG: OsmC family protein [Anaerolineae bacterium]
MTQATVTLVDGMQFVVETGSGHSFVIDSIPDVGGHDTGPRPFELLAAGLAGCTGMDVISILRTMRQKVTGLKVHVTGERAEEHPKKFLSIHIEYIVTGYDLVEERVARAIELSETKYCPAMASLRPGAPITSSYKILEATEETMKK